MLGLFEGLVGASCGVFILIMLKEKSEANNNKKGVRFHEGHAVAAKTFSLSFYIYYKRDYKREANNRVLKHSNTLKKIENKKKFLFFLYIIEKNKEKKI